METSRHRTAVQFGLVLLALQGCVAEEPWTRDKQESITTTTVNAPPGVVLRAAERAVRELAPRSVSFDYRTNGFRATRDYFAYFVIGAAQGSYLYDVQVTPAGAATNVEVKMFASSSTIAATGATPMTSDMWRSEDAYRLLQDRIRFHAGTLADWVSCSEARERYGTNGAIEPICLAARATDPQD